MIETNLHTFNVTVKAQLYKTIDLMKLDIELIHGESSTLPVGP